MCHTRQYQTWADMKGRCDNKKNDRYHCYGGRGISYSSKWNTFVGFWEDMKEGYSNDLTLDRTDNDGNYTKENCRWIPMSEQYETRNKPYTFKERLK